MIISCSRRTDIPACYPDDFMKMIKLGYCEVVNPYNNKLSKVSLLPSDVTAFVFWSKNYTPFTSILQKLSEMGYSFYLNYTVNNYPAGIEHLTDTNDNIINNLRKLSRNYKIFWRYDPVYISETTDTIFHLDNFRFLCDSFSGYAERVIINFLQPYPTVIKKLSRVTENLRPVLLNDEQTIEIALKLKLIADEYDIKMYSCNKLLYENNITGKSHCVDKDTIEKITGKTITEKIVPTYEGCNCYKSTDIGSYSTCHNSCIYCYACKSNISR